MGTDEGTRKAWLVGGGIASLAAAAYLLRFLRLFPDLPTLSIVHSTRYNGHDSIVRDQANPRIGPVGAGREPSPGAVPASRRRDPDFGSKGDRRWRCTR